MKEGGGESEGENEGRQLEMEKEKRGRVGRCEEREEGRKTPMVAAYAVKLRLDGLLDRTATVG